MKLSARQSLAITAAPLAGALSVTLGQAHVFGVGDRADALQGVVAGIGIGIALTALLFRKRLARC